MKPKQLVKVFFNQANKFNNPILILQLTAMSSKRKSLPTKISLSRSSDDMVAEDKLDEKGSRVDGEDEAESDIEYKDDTEFNSEIDNHSDADDSEESNIAIRKSMVENRLKKYRIDDNHEIHRDERRNGQKLKSTNDEDKSKVLREQEKR